jgi:hypothetical protein
MKMDMDKLGLGDEDNRNTFEQIPSDQKFITVGVVITNMDKWV